MNKIVCLILGHKWCPWHPSCVDAKYDTRACDRCGTRERKRVI